METREELLQGKLSNIERGARAFQILGAVFVVVGCILLGAAALGLLRLLGDGSLGEALAASWERVLSAVHYFVLAWLSRRASDAFESIAGLISEIGEIV